MSCSFMSQTNISSGCKKEESILTSDDHNSFVFLLGRNIYTIYLILNVILTS